MIFRYVCMAKCFFRSRIWDIGDKVLMDTAEGDIHPWFVRDPKYTPPLQIDDKDMKIPEKEGKATTDKKAVAKPVSSKKRNTETKSNDQT